MPVQQADTPFSWYDIVTLRLHQFCMYLGTASLYVRTLCITFNRGSRVEL